MTPGLVFRSATVVDGTGAPSREADVVVAGGRVAAITAPRTASVPHGAEEVDARGLVLAPGFIDVHTHYDAQLFFEPTASPASWHGVTTVVTGNCGFSLAPSHPSDLDWLLRSLARVEGMQIETLLDGVDFAGGSFADYLARLRGALGINVVALVGHCALRRHVMGAAASEREATDTEVRAMCALLDDALREGAYGFSTAQLDIHADHEGRPVPSNLAAASEVIALCAVLAEHPGSVIEIAPRTSLPGYSDADRDLLFAMARASQAPVNVNMIDWFPGFTDGWRTNLATAEAAAAEGLRILPMLRANPQDMYFRFVDTFIFDDVPALRDALVLDAAERLDALRDPARRDAIRRDLAAGPRSVDFSWDRVSVAAVADPALATADGRTLVDLAAERSATDLLDVVLDLALADDLRTLFRIDRGQGPGHATFRKEMATNPLLIAGASDGGAHLQTFCGADYPTKLLTDLVPDPLTIEQAIHKLAGQPAAMLGLTDRGVLREGAVADLVLLDPARLGVPATRFVTDFPAGGSRLVHEASGYRLVVVGGEVVLRDGAATGARPGAVLERTPCRLLLDDLQFGESPRWHDGRLWFSDILDGKVYTAGFDGRRTLVADLGDHRPSGIGFLPSGDALVVDMGLPGILRIGSDGERRVHADLTDVTVKLLNDMVVAPDGHAYVGSTGRNFFTGEPEAVPANIILVRPDGSHAVAADDVHTPNGCVLTPDGATFVVAESHLHRLLAFDVAPDRTLTNRRVWAELGPMMPDGICIDAEGAIWVASQTTGECARVLEGGEVTDRVRFDHTVIACALGGPDGRSLFVFGVTGSPTGPERSSVCHVVRVAVPAPTA